MGIIEHGNYRDCIGIIGYMLGLYGAKEKENGNYYNSFLDGWLSRAQELGLRISNLGLGATGFGV